MKNAKQNDALIAFLGAHKEIKKENVVGSLQSNLDISLPDKRLETTFVCTQEDLWILSSEGERKLPLSDISSLRSFMGVGCVFAEYKDIRGEVFLLARADKTKESAFSVFAKDCNRAIRTLKNEKEEMAEPFVHPKKICPSCHQEIPIGKKLCPQCSTVKSYFLRLAKISKPEWWLVGIASLLFFISTGIGIYLPYLNRIMVDDYIENENGLLYLWAFLGVVASIFLVNVLNRIVGICRSGVLALAGKRVIIRFRDRIFNRVQSLSIHRLSKFTTGNLMQIVGSDSNRVKTFLLNTLPSIIEQGLLLIAIVILLFWYDPLLAILILVPAPIVMFSFITFRRFMHRLHRQRVERSSKSNAVLHDIFSGIRVVKAYGMEKKEEAHFTSMAQSEMESQLHQEKIWAILMPVLNFFMGFGSYVLLYYVGKKMLVGEMTAGELAQFTAYASMIYGPLDNLLRFPRQYMHMKASLSRIFETLDEPDDMQDLPVSEVIPDFNGAIDFNHVSFGYEGGDDVLRDVNLHIEPGDFIGIVGKSGAGKSTLINLMMRMYDVEDGSIQIDGVDIRKIPQEELRRHMGVVLQETYLFAGSVMQNIAYAKPNATREELIQAAKIAGAHEFIVRLPDGYETYIGEHGYTLSGGERQRLSIARAILHDPQILILDEATSALDTETEKWIQDALKELCKGRTTFAIAHRLSTLRNATKLVVIDQGKVAEFGTHEELMQKNGIYASLVLAQREMTKL